MTEEVFRDANRSSDPEPGPSMDRFQKGVAQFLAKEDAPTAHVHGESIRFAMGGTWTAVLLAVITTAYIILEARWNVHLVAAVFGGDLPRDEMHALVESGRWLSAFGLAWALTKGVFLRESKSFVGAIAGALLVCATTAAGYVAISRSYDAALDAIPDPVASQLYKSAVWRSMTINDGAAQPAAQDPVATTLWPMKLLDGKAVVLMDAAFTSKEDQIRAQVTQRARDAWPELEAKLSQMGSKDALMQQFEGAYRKYISASEKLGSMFSSVQSRREAEFQRLSGMKPNANASREQFATEMLSSPIENLQALGRLYIDSAGGTADPVVFSKDGLTLHLSDLAGLNSEEAFLAHIERKVTAQLDEARSRPNLMQDAQARQAVAAAVLPPVAMLLSLLGVVLNAGALAGIALARVPVIRLVPQAMWPVIAIAAVCFLVPPVGAVPGLEAGFAALHAAAPTLSSFFERMVSLEYRLIALVF